MAFNIAIYLTLQQNNDNPDLFYLITLEEKRFMDALAERESSGNYKKINKFGYLGRYQFGEVALEELGYYKRKKRRWGRNNHWDGEWSGKHGIYSKKDFLYNPAIQDVAAKELFIKNWQYIKTAGLHKLIGKNINGIKITKSGLIAGSHLKGLGGLIKFLKKKEHVQDGLGTNIAEYIDKFKGYQLALKENTAGTKVG